MYLKNKSVVVVGGAGFIGSHLVERILQDEPESVTVIDNYFLGPNNNLDNLGVEIINEDASDFHEMLPIFDDILPDVVFNLATIPLPVSLEHPAKAYRTNIELGITICELARGDYFDTLIHFSSSEVYGTCVENPMSETHPLNGRTSYAASKAAVDMLALSYHHTFGIDVSIIRPFNTYGPRQNDKSYAAVIPITIRRILSGKQPIICGDGKQTRDFTYVTDVANAAVNIFDHASTKGVVINVASGKEVSIEYLVKQIAQILNYNGGIEYKEERIGDVRKHIADISRAKTCFDYTPKISFEEGLKKTVDWYVQK